MKKLFLPFLFVATALSAQLYTFDTVGMDDMNNIVRASGQVEYDGSVLAGTVTNTSENSSLLGIWFYGGPQTTLGTVQYASSPWDLQDKTPNFMNNLVGSKNRDNYFGFFLDVSTHGWGEALRYGDTFEFMVFANTQIGDLMDSYNVLFRWQQVGFDGEGSVKSIAYFNDPLILIPEPSVVGILGVMSVLGLFVTRRQL